MTNNIQLEVQEGVIVERPPYTTADEFFKKEKPRVVGGVKYYSATQIARAMSRTPMAVNRYIRNGIFQRQLGVGVLRDTINGRYVFPEDSVRGLFEHFLIVDRIIGGQSILRRTKEKTTQEIRDNVAPLEEIVQAGREQPTEVGIEAYDLKPHGWRPNIDALIEQGLSQTETGAKVGLSRERIRQYINASGQYSLWHERRNTKTNRNGQLQEIKYLLIARLSQQAKEQGWAYEKATEYKYIKSPRSSYSLPTLVDIFERYEDALNQGRKLSLDELAVGLGVSSVNVGFILKKVGLEPMYGSWNQNRIPADKVEAIKRGFNLEMPATDIAYFLGVPWYVVGLRFRNMGHVPFTGQFITQIGRSKLTYRLSYQIYEAQDLGFAQSEIAELLGTNQTVVNYAIGNRNSIESKIVEALKILNPPK